MRKKNTHLLFSPNIQSPPPHNNWIAWLAFHCVSCLTQSVISYFPRMPHIKTPHLSLRDGSVQLNSLEAVIQITKWCQTEFFSIEPVARAHKLASLRNDVGGLCQSPCFEYVVRNEVMLHIAFIITRQKNSDSTLPHKIIRNLCVFHSTKYNLTKVRLAIYVWQWLKVGNRWSSFQLLSYKVMVCTTTPTNIFITLLSHSWADFKKTYRHVSDTRT